MNGGSGGGIDVDHGDESGEKGGEDEPVEYMEDHAEEGNEYDDNDLWVNEFPN